MNITDAYGNRWDKQEWLEMGQSEQAWNTIVKLTARLALAESAIRKVDDSHGASEGVNVVGYYLDADSPEGQLWQEIVKPPAAP